MKMLCALALLLASTETCAASSAFCDDIAFTSLGRIVAPSRVHFLSDDGNCPSEAPRCILPAYLVPGDVALLGEKEGKWRCVMFFDKKGKKEGWMPSAALQEVPTSDHPPREAWLGNWTRDADAYLSIVPKDPARDSVFLVRGQALEPDRSRPGLQDGVLDGEARPEGDSLTVVAPGAKDTWKCTAWLMLVGPYLMVMDNGECGVNVEFDGIYRRG